MLSILSEQELARLFDDYIPMSDKDQQELEREELEWMEHRVNLLLVESEG